MNGTRLIYQTIDYRARHNEQTMAELFANAQDQLHLLPVPDRNYFRTLGKYGKDFSETPVYIPSWEELVEHFGHLALDVYDCECHNFAYHELSTWAHKLGFKLWWGLVDYREGSTYKGMFVHSFLTFQSKEGLMVWDSMLMREVLMDSGCIIYSHYGIQLPLEYLKRIELYAKPREMNHSSFLKQKVFRSTKETRKLCRVLEKNKADPF